ncbi:PQQ-binding-like beta-propeller repeat protein [Hoyosella altamirensis]|uniref:Outer membrane protein assembly factor BamB n=1 Tax=Hoyosella altamirensis TaxID=616997 RepID=A0A839RJT1_9ACTN|nr:PQQ-binding-like beta-propeller repeat protein [Hoyosella altamirensis]MBB3036559.1 outer membrane protein assembly factor BamB [Hoyosella altamirensis]
MLGQRCVIIAATCVVLAGCSAPDANDPSLFEHTATVQEPGFSSKPTDQAAVVGNTVVVPSGRDLVAFEIPSGEEVWRNTVFPEPQTRDLPGVFGISAPAVHADGLHATYIVDVETHPSSYEHDLELVVVSLTDGAVLSRSKASTRFTPTFERLDMVYADETLLVVANDSVVVGFDARSGDSLWTAGNYAGASADIVLTVSGRDALRALDPRTGSEQWTALEGTADISVHYVGDEQILVSANGEQIVLDPRSGAAMDQGSLTGVAEHQKCDRVTSDVILCGRRQPGVPAAYDYATGEQLWVSPGEGEVITGQFGDELYVIQDYQPTVKDLRTGEILSTWQGVPLELVVADGAVTGLSPEDGGALYFQQAPDRG